MAGEVIDEALARHRRAYGRHHLAAVLVDTYANGSETAQEVESDGMGVTKGTQYSGRSASSSADTRSLQKTPTVPKASNMAIAIIFFIAFMTYNNIIEYPQSSYPKELKEL